MTCAPSFKVKDSGAMQSLRVSWGIWVCDRPTVFGSVAVRCTIDVSQPSWIRSASWRSGKSSVASAPLFATGLCNFRNLSMRLGETTFSNLDQHCGKFWIPLPVSLNQTDGVPDGVVPCLGLEVELRAAIHRGLRVENESRKLRERN